MEKENRQSIYQELLAAGVEIDHREADLYCPVTQDSAHLISEFFAYPENITIFVSEVDNDFWYEIPLAYDPFWEKIGEEGRKEYCESRVERKPKGDVTASPGSIADFHFETDYDPDDHESRETYLEWLKYENERLENLYNRIEHDRLVQEYKDKQQARREMYVISHSKKRGLLRRK